MEAFQADCTVLFDIIITITGSQIEQQQDNNTCLSYWLSNTAVLSSGAASSLPVAALSTPVSGDLPHYLSLSRSVLLFPNLFKLSAVNKTLPASCICMHHFACSLSNADCFAQHVQISCLLIISCDCCHQDCAAEMTKCFGTCTYCMWIVSNSFMKLKQLI